MRTCSCGVKELGAVPDLDAITNAVFAAMHEGETVVLDRYLPPAEADEWRTVRLALEKMPMDAVVDLCRAKGAFVIARKLLREM